MLDTAAMQEEFEEAIADSSVPTPRITTRPASQLATAAPQPTGTPLAWATPKNLILIGLGVVSAGIAIAAVASSQPNTPPVPIVPLKVATLNEAAPEILERNTKERKKSLEQTNELVRQGLTQADNTAVRVNATKELLDAEEAVKKGDKQCLRSDIGRNCLLNLREALWADRLKKANAVKDADQIVVATNRLRAIEMARSGKVEIVESDLEIIELALRDRYNTRNEILESSVNQQARQLNRLKL